MEPISQSNKYRSVVNRGYGARVVTMKTELENMKLADANDLQKIRELNQNMVKLPDDQCIHHHFERQAQKTPDRIAVSFADQTMTYGELEERSNQLAHYLISCGVKPDTFVGICIERSLESLRRAERISPLIRNTRKTDWHTWLKIPACLRFSRRKG